LIKNKVLNESNSYCKHKEISPGDHDHDNKEDTKFPGMKQYGQAIIVNPIHKLEKVFDVEIPSRAPHIINNMV
jgi:hypothetical protein